ncbi:MAG: hypothetical protein HQK54_11035 [Oligoflexales bacterium]|nr:hypothetical protein [Oligoflexales bacterium]
MMVSTKSCSGLLQVSSSLSKTAEDVPPGKKMVEPLDDSCGRMLRLRKMEVLENLVSDSVSSCISKKVRHPLDIKRVEEALNLVPAKANRNLTVEQIRKGGAEALEKIDVIELAKKEASQRNRLIGYFNQAGLDTRYSNFSEWIDHLSQKRIGRRPPQEMNRSQVIDFNNEFCELKAARSMKNEFSEGKIYLAMDQIKERDPALRGKKSFDLEFVDKAGKVRKYVEVTTVQHPVRRASDLFNGVIHGVKKSYDLPGSGKHTVPGCTREVTICIDWFSGEESSAGGGKTVYNGDGTYTVFDRFGNSRETRHIARDDLPSFLARSGKVISPWIDRVNLYDNRTEACFHFDKTGGNKWNCTYQDISSDEVERERYRHEELKRALSEDRL